MCPSTCTPTWRARQPRALRPSCAPGGSPAASWLELSSRCHFNIQVQRAARLPGAPPCQPRACDQSEERTCQQAPFNRPRALSTATGAMGYKVRRQGGDPADERKSCTARRAGCSRTRAPQAWLYVEGGRMRAIFPRGRAALPACVARRPLVSAAPLIDVANKKVRARAPSAGRPAGLLCAIGGASRWRYGVLAWR